MVVVHIRFTSEGPLFFLQCLTASTARPSRARGLYQRRYIYTCMYMYSTGRKKEKKRQMVCVCVCCASIFTLPGIRQRGAPQRAQVDLFLLELWCSEQVDQALLTALSAGVNHSGHFPFYWAFFRLLLYYSRFISLCDHVILFLLSPFSFFSFSPFFSFLSFILSQQPYFLLLRIQPILFYIQTWSPFLYILWSFYFFEIV